MRTELILASNSPRRAEILRRAGFEFAVRAARVDESQLPGEGAEAYVQRLAREKARAAAEGLGDDVRKALVLGADTTVVAEGQILGKPVDAADARRMLRLLSGKAHEVLTGVAILARPGGGEIATVERTVVRFNTLSEADITNYIASGEPFDKAGAYGIQGIGGRFIPRVEGCYFNVMGLPLSRVCAMLRELGVPAAYSSEAES